MPVIAFMDSVAINRNTRRAPGEEDRWCIWGDGGLAIESRYPENRLGKLYAMLGYKGDLQVFDATTGMLRITVDIETQGRRMLTETDADGIRMQPWAPNSEASMKSALDAICAVQGVVHHAEASKDRRPVSFTRLGRATVPRRRDAEAGGGEG